jgi:intermediate peptidase
MRHELATLQNFPSYVERNLLDKMIGTSTTDVVQFLNIAIQQNQTSFRDDMTLLSKTKKQIEGGNAMLEPWDMTYYTGIIKAHCYQDLHQNVSQYLSVSNCINAMQVLVHELFGITMQESSMSYIEQWDVDRTMSSSSSSTTTTTTKLRKFQFTGPDERPLGTMYLDLHPRDNKYNHAAHFTVRCGCVITPNIRYQNSNDTYDNDEEQLYQYPIIALVCNLSDSTSLVHAEVETLFHEFGHALHSLLSRTKFQHLSGTRTAVDFVETPSHLFEHFVWDAQFLQLLGRHHSTGEVMPMTLIQQIQQSRHKLASIERQNQILYSLFDQIIFGRPDSSNISPTQLFGALHKQLHIPYADGTHWFTRFGHLVSYGGGYYGYLYAQVFARDIWTHCFQQQSLDRTAGKQLWQKLLQYGGAKDPNIMLTDLLGRSPKVSFTSQ